ncbi:uncharacterized protein MELLADRAFT_103578 [Melampsora larici-populina 98AG31]|uniref:Secreted protein n=1 Tax=Melampsora larici-populina (strain 98AG31 / pathotype 3-4-7) TaxID=747676 RepID=F4RBT3_MELLP|nr:uncharacterized protein MELLADRAFT_103578 [Melampsora larici-populina 98AG31]EGG10283.1 hypothetical protein MELLADRAFT_103578 [Melampsora larici-populina 98AG31]
MRLFLYQDLCFAALLLHLISSTFQHPLIKEIKDRSALDKIITNQASLLHGDIDGSSNSRFSEVTSEIKNIRKRKSHFISHPPSGTHTAKRIENDESPNKSDKALEITNQGSYLDSLLIHLQPHLWPWEDQDMKRQTVRDSEQTNLVMGQLEEGEIKETKLSGGQDKKKLAIIMNESCHISIGKGHQVHSNQNKALSDEETSFQEILKAKTPKDEDMRISRGKVTDVPMCQGKKTGMTSDPLSNKKGDELLKHEMIKILNELKYQIVTSGYTNMKVAKIQLKRLIELEKSMKKLDFECAWTKVRSSFGEGKSRNWEKSIRAQVQQFKLIEGWRVIKTNASDDLKECMKLLQVEEYWPVFSEMKYKTLTDTMNLIKKIRQEKNGHAYQELCRLLPPKLLQHRLSRMAYMAKRSDFISQLYSDEDLKSKQERGYDTLWILLIEEALYSATQIDSETYLSDTKDKDTWDVFVKLFRLIHEHDVIDKDSLLFNIRYKGSYWISSIDFELFSGGSTPQSHRFKKGFNILLRHLDKIENIYEGSMDKNKFSKLMKSAGDWSPTDILLGIHYGVRLESFGALSHLAKSKHHTYTHELSQLDKEKIRRPQVQDFENFLKAHIELQRQGIISCCKPLKSLRLLQSR